MPRYILEFDNQEELVMYSEEEREEGGPHIDRAVDRRN